MAKIKTIPCDIYRQNINVFLGTDEEFRKLKQLIKKDIGR